MMSILSIDNGVEVGLNHDLNHMLHGSILVFEFRCDEGTVASRAFLLPDHYDELVPFLFDISLTHTIHHAFRHTQVCKGQTYLSAYSFYIVTSTNHQTNITPNLMLAISKWKELLSHTE